jgi:hypothetical protein
MSATAKSLFDALKRVEGIKEVSFDDRQIRINLPPVSGKNQGGNETRRNFVRKSQPGGLNRISTHHSQGGFGMLSSVTRGVRQLGSRRQVEEPQEVAGLRLNELSRQALWILGTMQDFL